ncbi:MAG: VWA domain-containing protein [Cyanobacteria bacterium SID2]|nr:VWA domain-containing protein [Cyanobacteria bacterium SID2]MBP0002399.1 VWA domain-containing protein [Cyanobacteria bacterium SBC]
MFSPYPDFEHLTATLPDGKAVVFALKQTRITARISGNIARVEVEQHFENPLTQTLEAVYVFPLPDEAAVDEMEMRVGDRVVRGNIQKREDARQIYQAAKRQGRTASLLEQERNNIFTYSIANVRPGEQISVILRYSDSLKFENGDYEFVAPTVVGPRFIPDRSDVEGHRVPDADRVTPPIASSNQLTDPLLDITVEIEAGVPVKSVRSPSHRINLNFENDTIQVKLDRSDTVSNKDFILRYQVSGEHTRSTVLTHADDRGAHFAAYLIPALTYPEDAIVPKDVVFLIDTSGSQAGPPLEKCKELLRRFITGLNPDDTFSLLDFCDTVGYLSHESLTNTPENRANALVYIDRLEASGGTHMLAGLRSILDFPEPDDGRLRSIVLLTDGFIGNDREILGTVRQLLEPSHRLYSFGAGSSVNRDLLNRIAEIGRGYSQIVRHDESIDDATHKFFDRVNCPVLTDVRVTWDGAGEVPTVYPNPLPDLFVTQPLVLFGRSENRGSGRMTVSGRQANGAQYEETLSVQFDDGGNPAISQLWGRAYLKSLSHQTLEVERRSIVEEMTQTALTYQLLSPYTAFVAVTDDPSAEVEDASNLVSATVPTILPEGMNSQFLSPFAGRGYRSSMAIYRAPRPRKSLTNDDVGFAVEDFCDSLETGDFLEKESGNLDETYLAPLPNSTPNPIRRRKRSTSSESEREVVKIELSRVEGLDYQDIFLRRSIVKLRQSLDALQFPADWIDRRSGQLYLTVEVVSGKVNDVMLDEERSMVKHAKIVQKIAEILFKWQLPPMLSCHISVKLCVN